MKSTLLGCAAAAFIFALVLGSMAWRLYQSERQFLGRPTVNGKVLSITLSEAAEGSVSATATGAMNNYRRVAIDYEYFVAGRRYVGHKISNSPPVESVDANPRPSAKISAYLDRYRTGSPVTVHYQEARPENSYLEIDVSGSRWFGAGVVALLLTATALLLRALAS